MTENEFFEFHEGSFLEFLDSWLGPEERSEEEFSVNFAAYHALAHAGMLLRARGTEQIPEGLAGLSGAARKNRFGRVRICARLRRPRAIEKNSFD